MAFEFVAGRWFLGFWYFDLPPRIEGFGQLGPFGKGGNFNMLVWRQGTDDGNGQKVSWSVQWRFRYYRDARIHDHNDEMDWFSGEVAAATCAEVDASTSAVATKMATAAGTLFDFWPIRGDYVEFCLRAASAPPYWMHTVSGMKEAIKALVI